MKKEMKMNERVNELTRKKKIEMHNRSRLLEYIKDAKSCGLTMEDIT